MEAWLFLSPTLIGFLILLCRTADRRGPSTRSPSGTSCRNSRPSSAWTISGTNALFRNADFWLVVPQFDRFFAIGLVPLNMALALVLALALSRRFPGVIFFRTVFFAPVVTSAVAWAIVWKFL